MMAAGRIEIFRRVYDGEGVRKIEKDPERYYSAWCEIGSLYGNELYKALEIRLENAVIFEVRYCRKIKEVKKRTKDYIVKYDGDTYEIYAVDFRKNERDKVQIKANLVN